MENFPFFSSVVRGNLGNYSNLMRNFDTVLCRNMRGSLHITAKNLTTLLICHAITSMQNFLLFCQLHQCKTISCSVNYINAKQFLVLSITSIQNNFLFCQLHQYKTISCSVNYINTKLGLVLSITSIQNYLLSIQNYLLFCQLHQQGSI